MKKGRIRSRHQRPPPKKRESELTVMFLSRVRQLRCKCGVLKNSSFLESLDVGWTLHIPDQVLINSRDILAVCPTCSSELPTSPSPTTN